MPNLFEAVRQSELLNVNLEWLLKGVGAMEASNEELTPVDMIAANPDALIKALQTWKGVSESTDDKTQINVFIQSLERSLYGEQQEDEDAKETG